MWDKKLHPQGDGVFGYGEQGMGHGEEVTNRLVESVLILTGANGNVSGSAPDF